MGSPVWESLTTVRFRVSGKAKFSLTSRFRVYLYKWCCHPWLRKWQRRNNFIARFFCCSPALFICSSKYVWNIYKFNGKVCCEGVCFVVIIEKWQLSSVCIDSRKMALRSQWKKTGELPGKDWWPGKEEESGGKQRQQK